MIQKPIDDAIEHAIGGGWGGEEPAYGSQPVTVIRGADFPSVDLQHLDGAPRRFESTKKVVSRSLRCDDIVLEISGGTKDRPTGRTVFITDRVLDASLVPVIPASFCRLLRINSRLAVPRFVYYCLQDLYRQGGTWAFQNQSTGLSNFQFELFRSRYRFPAFELAEQQAIAEVLGALDDKIAANQRTATVGAKLADALFLAAREQAEVHLTPLSRLVTTQYGITTSAADGGGPRLLRVTDINKRPWVEWSTAPSCTLAPGEWGKYQLRGGDILVARMADPGKAALIDEWDEDAVFASYLVRLTAHEPSHARYIYYYLRSREYQDYAAAATTGSVQRNMNARVIVGTRIAMPPAKVLSSFNEKVTAVRASIAAVLRETRRLAQTRDALLPLLMSGKVRVKDAEKVAEGAL